jgi:iron complex outermembrane receptor protein
MPAPIRLLAGALTILIAHASLADDAPIAPGAELLEQIEVKADGNADAEVAPPTPQPRYTIDAVALPRMIVVNAEDALKYAPNLHVRKRHIGDDNGIVSVRGTSTRQSARTLVYADGLLLSNLLGSDFTFAPRWSMVVPDELARVDVLYGPYSARYPGNSLGATVLLTTRMPDAFEAMAHTRFFSQGYAHNGVDRSFDGHRSGASIGSRSGAWSYRLDVDRLDTDGQPLSFFTLLQSTLTAEAGDVAVSGALPWIDQRGRPGYLFGINGEGITRTRNDQLKVKLGWDVTPELQATLTAAEWRQDVHHDTASALRDSDGLPVSSGIVAIDGFRYTLPGNAFAPSSSDSHRRLYGVTLRSLHETGWNYAVTASRFAVGSDRSRTASTAGDGPGTVTFGDGTGWGTFDAVADYRPGAGDPAHALAIGFHIDRYRLDSETFDTADWTGNAVEAFNAAFAGRTRTQAAFIEDRWTFAPGWTLVPGLRFEHWTADQGRRALGEVDLAYPSRSRSALSPKLSLEHAFADEWIARMSLARAVRFPTVSELFQGRITGTTIVNNDPDLEPEVSFSKDLTFERTLGDAHLRVSLYEDDVRDVLFSQTNTTVFPIVTSIQNVDRVRSRGIEVAWEAHDVFVEGFDLATSVARNRAITRRNANFPESEGKYFYRIPDWRADMIGTYRFTPAVSATLAARYSGRQYNTLDNIDTNPRTFGGTSRYLVVDAKVNVDLGAHVALGVGVENLNDEEYYVYHPYPGRTWLAEATVRY